jgi:hypothetical protein
MALEAQGFNAKVTERYRGFFSHKIGGKTKIALFAGVFLSLES